MFTYERVFSTVIDGCRLAETLQDYWEERENNRFFVKDETNFRGVAMFEVTLETVRVKYDQVDETFNNLESFSEFVNIVIHDIDVLRLQGYDY